MFLELVTLNLSKWTIEIALHNSFAKPAPEYTWYWSIISDFGFLQLQSGLRQAKNASRKCFSVRRRYGITRAIRRLPHVCPCIALQVWKIVRGQSARQSENVLGSALLYQIFKSPGNNHHFVGNWPRFFGSRQLAVSSPEFFKVNIFLWAYQRL